MNKNIAKQKEQVVEFKQALPGLGILFALCYSRFLVEDWAGKGWANVAAVAAVIASFIIRPWRFGLLSSEVRREIQLTGTIAFYGFGVVEAPSYWQYGRH